MRERVEATWRYPRAQRSRNLIPGFVLLGSAVLLAFIGLAIVGAGARPDQIVRPSAIVAPASNAAATPTIPQTELAIIGGIRSFVVPAGAAAHEQLCQFIVESDCAADITFADSSIWTTTSGGLSRVDPASGDVIADVPVGAFPHRIAVLDGQLWVTVEKPGRVVRIDPTTNAIAATIDVGGTPVGLTRSGDSLWVVDTTGDRVVRVDIGTERVVGSLDVGKAPWGIVELAGSLWVSDRYATTLWRIDPSTGTVIDTIDVQGTDTPDYGPEGDLTVARGRIWIAGHDKIKAFDPTTKEITERYVPTFPNIAITATAIWSSSSWTQTLTKLDPTTLELLAQQALPMDSDGRAGWEAPIAVSDDGAVWIRTYDSDALLRVEPTR